MCPPETVLVQFVAEELSQTQRQELLNHLETCSRCRDLCQELRATWDLLGQWTDIPQGRDLTSVILAAARRPSIGKNWMSLAASILLAAGAGVAAGILIPRSPAVRSIETAAPVQQLLEQAGLDSLAGQTVVFAPLFSYEPISGDAAEEPGL